MSLFTIKFFITLRTVIKVRREVCTLLWCCGSICIFLFVMDRKFNDIDSLLKLNTTWPGSQGFLFFRPLLTTLWQEKIFKSKIYVSSNFTSKWVPQVCSSERIVPKNLSKSVHILYFHRYSKNIFLKSRCLKRTTNFLVAYPSPQKSLKSWVPISRKFCISGISNERLRYRITHF